MDSQEIFRRNFRVLLSRWETQRAAAAALGVCHVQLCDMLAGRRGFSHRFQERVAVEFSLQFWQLFLPKKDFTALPAVANIRTSRRVS